MTTIIFYEFLAAVDGSMSVQSRKILLFVDICATCLPYTSFLRNVKVAYFPPNCTSMLQPLNLGILKCFRLYYRNHLVQKAVYEDEFCKQYISL